MKLRPEVGRFACLLEERLQANDEKPGWKQDSAESLFYTLKRQQMRLGVLLGMTAGSITNPAQWRADVAKRAAAVANMAMMIVDVTGGLPDETPSG